MRPASRVLYVQYTNPAAYPPIQHSARLLADAGCEVLLLGTGMLSDVLTMAPHQGIRLELQPPAVAGWRQKWHYLRFAIGVARKVRRWRPHWIYASDPLACPIVWLLGLGGGVRTVYHEHDSPAEFDTSASRFMRLALAARRRVAAHADLCVFPNSVRAEAFQRDHPRARVVTVWNCPTREEVCAAAPGRASGLRVVYHGSIGPALLPETVLDALTLLPDTVSLDVVGYETAGVVGYSRQLRARAERLGLANRVRVLGPVARRELMHRCSQYDVGLALHASAAADPDGCAMVGASNKPFDYMAGGLPVLVPETPRWQSTFVEPGFGLACDRTSPASIAAALRVLLQDPGRRQTMGERARLQILGEWNYEQVFAPVLARIMQSGVSRAVSVDALLTRPGALPQ